MIGVSITSQTKYTNFEEVPAAAYIESRVM